MKRELGDIMWYWATACMALKLDPYEVIKENQDKLEARYGEKFEVDRSEHRKDGDLYNCRLGGNGIAIAKLNPVQSNK